MQTQIHKTLNQISVLYYKRSEELLNEIGLHTGQARILAVLWQKDGISQAEIVKELSISAPTVNSLVSKLETSKLLKCKNCPRDKRLMRVFLTKKGQDFRAKTNEKFQELDELILREFSDTEKVLILMLLEKINNNLQVSENSL